MNVVVKHSAVNTPTSASEWSVEVRVAVQHSANNESSTSLGATPSYRVRKCSCFRFSCRSVQVRIKWAIIEERFLRHICPRPAFTLLLKVTVAQDRSACKWHGLIERGQDMRRGLNLKQYSFIYNRLQRFIYNPHRMLSWYSACVASSRFLFLLAAFQWEQRAMQLNSVIPTLGDFSCCR
jgi:hypothetical protein